MNIALGQIKYRTADFKFNFTQIKNAILNLEEQNSNLDLIILPSLNTGIKDLILDSDCCDEISRIYEKIALIAPERPILLGNILFHNNEFGKIERFNLCDKEIYVSEEYSDEIICDLFVLCKNSYFSINTYNEFIDSIEAKSKLIYSNAICMADESIYCGGSFAKNENNELIAKYPLCEDTFSVLNFDQVLKNHKESMEEQIHTVITFALREYCESVGFKKVILGLSGGIDSALTAALAVDALGAENVKGVLLPSMFSSEGSITDAEKLAKNLGIKTETFSITPLFDKFINEIAKERKYDLAEENLQARLRGLILMFFSNRENYLLLTTGNKSEIAMGYGTLYGDMAGGLNLICDLTKTNVYKLSNWINRNGEIIPQSTIDKAPSAELRPNQKDQDSLPEYEILDDIIELYIEQCTPIDEIYKKYEKVIVDSTIRKIYRAQFKRKQTCLGIRLSERSFTSGVNIPILQKFY